jgi:hypothetical protein
MDIPYNLRSSNRRLSSSLHYIPIPVIMTTVADALAATNVVTAAITATDARMDAKEQGQTTISIKMMTLTLQLHALITSGVGASVGGAGDVNNASIIHRDGGNGGGSGVRDGGVAPSEAGHAVPHQR